MPDLDYLDDLRRESARFLACVARADPAARVPSCPDWTTADLVWHLTMVQTIWGTIVRNSLQAWPERQPERPDADYRALLQGFVDASSALVDALENAAEDVPVWTWTDDKSVGFVRRRQAHEVLIHRLDAETAVGDITDLPVVLAADGVDEALCVMLGGYPEWMSYQAIPGTGRIVCTDTAGEWDLTFGRWAGTGPETGTTYDRPGLSVASGPPTGDPDVMVTGTAAELDAWLWGRKTFPEPVVDGDRQVAGALHAVIAAGIP